MYLKLILFFLSFLFLSQFVLADSATLNNGGTTNSQQDVDNDDEFLTVTNNSTLNTGATKPANITGDTVSVTVDSGSTITSNTVSIFADDTSDLTISNSGTISASGIVAIDVKGTTDASITNNSSGQISSTRNTIRISNSASNNTTGMTITNSGTIEATTDGSAIFASGSNATATVTNNSSGIMTNSDTSNATIRVGANSSITNSGTIKNDVGNDAIKLYGNNSTIILKDRSIIVGKLDGTSRTGSTLKINHGVGQSYFYETEGSFTLQDLDGNQVVKGSAGSVGQGGNETLDELLSYKSLNIRQFLNRYKDSENLYDSNGWGETYSSYFKRNGHASNLALEYDLFNIGANLISPMENSDFILAFEAGAQDFERDNKITYQNISAGLYFPNGKHFFNLDSFILGGISLKEGERTILTNTTSSGKLDINSNYQTFELHSGITKTNSKLIPNFGLTGSLSITPSYDESKYYSWRNRKVVNVSVFFSDKYELIQDVKNNLNLGWTLDLRSLVENKSQIYSINGTSATYEQDNALTREISLIANLNYEKKITDNGKFTAGITAKNTSQDVKGLNGNIGFKLNF
tara:strand:- start:3110 stop:4846 length:1737 start_codon:yes stop_codon:yes gene_type:complete